jgi:hypothetical protein
MYTPRISGIRLVAIIVPLLLAAAPAGAGTVATFADPAPDGSTPLFDLSGTLFTGGWSGLNLTLDMPITSSVWDNVTFTMTPLSVTGPGQLGPGTIQFFKSAADGGGLALQIDFDAALLAPFGWGASDLFSSETVTFSGPGIPSGLSAETFAFSFANPEPTGDGYTYTASFTSSAVPEPATLLLLAVGLLKLVRRH